MHYITTIVLATSVGRPNERQEDVHTCIFFRDYFSSQPRENRVIHANKIDYPNCIAAFSSLRKSIFRNSLLIHFNLIFKNKLSFRLSLCALELFAMKIIHIRFAIKTSLVILYNNSHRPFAVNIIQSLIIVNYIL